MQYMKNKWFFIFFVFIHFLHSVYPTESCFIKTKVHIMWRKWHIIWNINYMKKNNEKCIWKKWTMVAHKGKLFLWTILISKLNFTFMFNLNFKINLNLNFKFISFKNQVLSFISFQFFFISKLLLRIGVSWTHSLPFYFLTYLNLITYDHIIKSM